MTLAAHSVVLPIDPVEAPSRPERHLKPVTTPAKTRKPRVAYALTALFGALLIGGAQMGLSLATTASTYDVLALNKEKRDLVMQTQILQEELAGLSSPQYLAANATASGMVIGASPTYLRLSDGAVVGTGEVATHPTVNVLTAPLVPNALIADTPLVTAPGSTIGGAIPVVTPPVAPVDPNAEVPVGPNAEAPVEQEIQLPPVISDGLPTPETR